MTLHLQRDIVFGQFLEKIPGDSGASEKKSAWQ
jgi:hypothetical protein